MDEIDHFYQNTWLCSGCDSRHPMTENYCQPCMERALVADEKKLRDERGQ